jgi:hypothetical protein
MPRDWNIASGKLGILLSFPVALKSPVVIEILPSLLSLPFLGFGIPRDILGILHSLCL